MRVALCNGTRPRKVSTYDRFSRWCTQLDCSHAEIVFSNGVSAVLLNQSVGATP